VPALYVGDKFENDELASWRVQLFLRDVDDGYRIAGKKVQEAWLHQIPNASDPDPVYRFLKAPSARLREEAQRFLRHAFETVWQRGQFPLDRLPVIRERAMPAMNAKERKRLLGIKQKIDLENRYIGESVAILNMFERIELFNMAIRQEEEEAAKEAAKETKKEETKQEVPKAHPPVLILGPKGAGKSVLAELIHNHSLRRGRFLRVQKSSVVGNSKEFVLEKFVGYGPNSTVESADKKGTEGFVQEVKGGTIFFDEVHGIESWFQTYLHDILDGEEIDRPHGDQIPVQPDVRIILASNRSLKELETELNDDFLDRIREYCIVVRALKDRKEDIPLFAKEWCEGYKRDEAFLLALLKYDWPGNVRELKSVVKKAKALAKMKKSGELSLECIELRDSKSLDDLRERDDGEVEQELYSTLHSILLAQGYEKGRGLQKRMAGILGLAEATITRKLKKYLPHRAPT
jgi:DNA-binding NtrC family response regulator